MMDYIIVQAGGKGTRLGYLTKNKPKALVSVDNLPMLFHLFSMFPDKKFVIIADYHRDVMRKYLEAFCEVKYQVVDADGTGTCAGVAQALELIPKAEPFMLVWSDLILPPALQLPPEYADGSGRPKRNYIGISETFPCRWKYENGVLEEESSEAHGVAGFFLFLGKEQLSSVPGSGELVRWMRDEKMQFEPLSLAGTREYGLLSEYEKLKMEKCRPFNKMTIEGDVVVKEGITEQGKKLAQRECAWYEQARNLGITALPVIYGTNPLKMEYIRGKNIYECGMNYKQKKSILYILVDSLKKLHESSRISSDSFSRKEAYFNKTFDRIDRIRNLVPFADREKITVNGKVCRNVFFYRRELEKCLEEITSDEFAFIHGDCTFSNIILREDGSPVLIDPRGYFGYSEMYGDVLYDWAKLYYSIRGNYDRFNLKDFRLSIGEENIALEIASNHWEDMEELFFELTGADRYEVKLIHAIIWLSLTTYAWQDYDSVCGAFYNGIFYLEDVLDGRYTADRRNLQKSSLQKHLAGGLQSGFAASFIGVQYQLILSSLGHTWILDLDGTIVKHNGYKIDGRDAFLEGAEAFLKSLPRQDKIIFLTSREESLKERTESFLKEHGIRFDCILYGMPYGERILFNDCKPSGLKMGIAVNMERDIFQKPELVIDENL